ncbi:tRNA lysidine(34) synthetase TilS [Echinicola sp. CAU 1574]|uniref:tRNA(Ile)-lysidine synthase n=1 Tax=Echinicola arenosa TaxID=2774144 RepID=A0ABR9AGJ7_9BACT|nr:tRNA lysidine(34) synthetase TilS [Echinicola arenosa]MBD8487882.1 tRNA lysidine(34) synthetase TilS [Echinicola arenosa]
MLEQFISHIRTKKLLDTDKQYLLAISGGIDSVGLARLLKKSAIPFRMAHCNFGLRGEESDGDELFVRELAQELGVEISVKRFETKVHASEKGVSTQMAARYLRYNWFEQLLEEFDLDGVVVAHHADDQLETVLLNLLRGTGIEGIYGMSEIRDYIIRPLLPFSRDDIENFAVKERFDWREDSSNSESTYKRNFLRNEVLPLIKRHDVSFEGNLRQSFDRLKDTGKAFFHLFDAWKKVHVKMDGEIQFLEKDGLKQVPGRKSLLYYWLRDYGFNNAQVDDILDVLWCGEVGQRFESELFMVNVDREYLILGKKVKDFEEVLLEKTDLELSFAEKVYDILILPIGSSLDIRSENAMLDRDSLKFPLLLRKWREGDRFRPLGMRKFKKISDFLIDLKVPMIIKKDVKVLCDADGEVVWVLGYRVDDRFKITPVTKEVMYFKLK